MAALDDEAWYALLAGTGLLVGSKEAAFAFRPLPSAVAFPLMYGAMMLFGGMNTAGEGNIQ